MPKETKQRIVSKGSYIRSVGKRMGLTLSGWGTILLGIACGIASFAGIVLSIINFFRLCNERTWQCLEITLVILVLTIVLGAATPFLERVGYTRLDRAMEIDVLPFTRANTAGLPAPDSLVRASEEPVQEPQSILLRTAIQGGQTPPEQLVRPQ